MHKVEPECGFCKCCRNRYRDRPRFGIDDGHWLEEIGNMTAAAVEGIRKVSSFSTVCFQIGLTKKYSDNGLRL